jgi:hypothetical protein
MTTAGMESRLKDSAFPCHSLFQFVYHGHSCISRSVIVYGRVMTSRSTDSQCLISEGPMVLSETIPMLNIFLHFSIYSANNNNRGFHSKSAHFSKSAIAPSQCQMSKAEAQICQRKHHSYQALYLYLSTTCSPTTISFADAIAGGDNSTPGKGLEGTPVSHRNGSYSLTLYLPHSTRNWLPRPHRRARRRDNTFGLTPPSQCSSAA